MVDLFQDGLTGNTERIQWIQRVCKGTGLLSMPEDFPYEMFGVSDWDGLVDLLALCQVRMPRWRSSEAIFLAINLQHAEEFRILGSRLSFESKLKTRREMWAQIWGISVRTFMRLEDQGAAILDDYIERLSGPSTVEELHLEHMHAVMELHRIFKKMGWTPELVNAYNALGKGERKWLVREQMDFRWRPIQDAPTDV